MELGALTDTTISTSDTASIDEDLKVTRTI